MGEEQANEEARNTSEGCFSMAMISTSRKEHARGMEQSHWVGGEHARKGGTY